jgi:hypothetical protein
MPKASVSLDYERFDLRTCEGGWVELKPMSYGEKLERAQIATDMTIEAVKGSKTSKAQVDIMQRRTALFELSKCVGDHNLYEDDAETVKLDFKSAKILDKLDPRVGDEIGKLIDEMNNFEDQEDELGN